MAADQKYICIERVKRGKRAGEFRFVQHARNGEPIGMSPPRMSYPARRQLQKVLDHNYADWKIVDKTKPKK